MGENFDKFDESKHRQNFSYQYFTFQLSASTCNIYGSRKSVLIANNQSFS